MSLYKDAIITNGLSKKYAHGSGVHQLNLRVKAGEVYGFLGPNGAGKSTTMKLLLGLIHPTAGQAEILGMPFTTENRVQILRNVGSLIESPSCYGHLTGMENMQVLQRLLDLPKKNIDQAIHIVRMENQMRKKVKEYSLGMKQRLGIAMALARFPKLLILDEPTNGLDPAGMEEIRELIRDLPKNYGTTVMISSHLLSEIEQMVTAVGIINRGRMVFQDEFCVLNSYKKPELYIRTDNNRAVVELFRQWQPKPERCGVLFPMMADTEASRLIYELCQNGIQVYRVETRQNSLEEVFLEMTGEGVTL